MRAFALAPASTLALTVALVALVAVVAVGCVPIERDAACVAAQACDQALERPFGDFEQTDPVFGDDLNGDGTVGDAGTCWANAEAAVPCVNACNDFLAEQIAIAQAQGNDAVILACGGSVEEE
jgi:hypothetical protein